MEVKKFRDSRDEKLSEFMQDFTTKRELYSSTLHSAILEQDPSQQQDLVQQVLQINADLSASLRDIIGDLNKGTDSFNPKTIDELTDDLIKYQKQYEEIQKSRDKVKTLRLIHSSTTQKLEDATSKYYVLFYCLIGLVFLVIFLVIKTSWTSAVSFTSFFTETSAIQ
jgi:hypothetical protein